MTLRNFAMSVPAALVLCLSLAATTFAQVNATASGTVTDVTGALIPGAEVDATNVNTGIVTSTVSNETGSYNFQSLQPGTYDLTASLPGFQTAVLSDVVLNQGSQVRLNFELQVGQVTQTVEVVVDADILLAQTSASVGDVLPDLEVSSLPLPTRNVIDLISITAGTVGDNFGGARMSQINTTRDGLPTNDGRFSDWNGAYSTIFTSPDLVEEVQINVTTVDAAMGRGSGQVRLRTRSGGNDLHGALFYTNFNSALSSQGWFQNLVGAQKSYQNRNQFGGRIGGPIVRNKAFFFVLYDGQRYLEKQNIRTTVLTGPARQGDFRYFPGRRNGNAFSRTASVDLNGNLTLPASELASFNLFDDVDDPNRTGIDPVWVGPEYLARMPLPNDWTVGDGLNTAGYRWLRRHSGTDSSTGTDPNTNRDHLTVRIDYQINDANKISYTMSREENWAVTRQTGLPDFPDGYFGEVNRVPDFYTANWTSTISPTVLNEFRWGFKRDSWVGWSSLYRGFKFGAPLAEQEFDEIATEARASFPEVLGTPFYIAQSMGLGNYASYGGAAPRNGLSPLWQFADTVSWTQGTHSFQTGFEWTRADSLQYSSGAGATINPSTTLGVGNVPVPGINSDNFTGLNASDIGTAENLLATLAGTVQQVTHGNFLNNSFDTEFSDFRDNTVKISNWHQIDFAGFIKDNWKVTTDFTLNLGLRYDKYGVPWDSDGLAGYINGGQAGMFGISGTGYDALWDPYASGGALTTVRMVGKNSPNPDITVHQNDWNNIAPSIGFSWSLPWFDRETIVRGGYGINYTGAPTFLQYTSQTTNMPGVSLARPLRPATYLDLQAATDPNANILPLDLGGAVPLSPVPLTARNINIQGWDDDRVVPYVQNFNLSVQRDLGANMIFDVSWIGTKGTKLRGAIELNEPNLFENGLLDAYNITRSGGDAALFDRMLDGIRIGGTTVGTNGTGSAALRAFAVTDQWFANGDVASLAEWLNSTPTGTGRNGGLLRTNGFPENFIMVNPQFADARLHGNYDNSIYHSLQAKVTRRFSQGLSGQFSYTWSKNLGYSLGGNARASDTTRNARDPRNRSLSRGLLRFHRSHGFKGNATWALPFGPGQTLLSQAPSWVNRVVEGWLVSSIFSWTSGVPMSFTSGRETLAGNADSNTADLVGNLPEGLGGVRVGDRVVEYFPNLSVQDAPLPNFGSDPNRLSGDFGNQVVVDASGNIVLQNPQPGTTGNTAFNFPALEGPGGLGLDAALSKSIQLNETTQFTLRADGINILNTPQWGNPNTDINSGNFGRITSATGQRTFVINARVEF